ncbi:hypothetical protein EI42_05827 [Thermosporothrix hazakensis]|jgi:DNA-directed RNA polymerase specialized sigma24 family protein|uniref:Uncharacterized protein n=1 Tax=Thermosporothrix hazakensis TaxID=644383 RepID=A0A326U8R6_THEHA|nr:hypothetical protein [Thermosporothrix hazakensis]PZW20821.1 hypothetical protein EI42_05827 [Thermosporothrix hazakensis]GCE47524.1 hypothetical protein KTH_23930 [Thermosporothrix hazakensis]
MPFTAHDLRYHPEQSFPVLYAYLQRNAQRFLGALQYDAIEVDTVVGHVIEQLVRLGLFGGGDTTAETVFDRMTDAQFYAFLSRMVHNKAIDRQRKRRLRVQPTAELEYFQGDEGDESPLDEAVEPVWGAAPFSTPEEITVHLASQLELRDLLKHCIVVLRAAPLQLNAVVQELRDIGADELLEDIFVELNMEPPAATQNPHLSQHKDHAHRKLRHCLQQKSTNLTVIVALRLIECMASQKKECQISTEQLVGDDLSFDDVKIGLRELAAEGLLDWQEEETVHLTASQAKRLTRFYREE